jgi:type IV secretory pathway component VirB8
MPYGIYKNFSSEYVFLHTVINCVLPLQEPAPHVMVFTPQTNVFTILLQSAAEKLLALESPVFYNISSKQIFVISYDL